MSYLSSLINPTVKRSYLDSLLYPTEQRSYLDTLLTPANAISPPPPPPPPPLPPPPAPIPVPVPAPVPVPVPAPVPISAAPAASSTPDFSRFQIKADPGLLYSVTGDGQEGLTRNGDYFYVEDPAEFRAAVQQAQAYRAANVQNLGNNLYQVEDNGYFFGNDKLDRKSALDLISNGVNVPLDALTSTGLGSDDAFRHSFRFAHFRSPAYQTMVDQFDSNYGTKGVRNLATSIANQIGVNPEVFNKAAGAKFRQMLENNEYHISDQSSLNKLANVVFDEAQKITGRAVPEEIKKQAYDYTGQIKSLWDIPHPKTSGIVKQVASGAVGGVLDLAGSLLKPVGLEKYAAPIVGAGITAASGGTLGTVGAAIAGGAFAGGANQIAAGDFSGGLKGAAIGGAAGGIGGLASTVNPVTSLGAQGNLIANQTIQGGLGGAVGGLLSGQDPLKSGLLGAGLAGATTALSTGIQSGANAVKNAVSPNRGDISTGLSPADSFGAGAARQPGINMDRFNPSTGLATDGLSVGTGGVGLRQPTTPLIGGMGNGVGLVSALRDRNGNVVAYQGVNGIVRPGFVNAIGDINSYINDPNLQGRDVVQAGQVRNFGVTPPVRSELSDKAAERLIGGLLGGGAIAAGAGLLGNRGGNGGQMPQQVARPLDQFQINPQVNQYTGDFDTFGERGSQGFRFYNAPVTGLLG